MISESCLWLANHIQRLWDIEVEWLDYISIFQTEVEWLDCISIFYWFQAFRKVVLYSICTISINYLYSYWKLILLPGMENKMALFKHRKAQICGANFTRASRNHSLLVRQSGAQSPEIPSLVSCNTISQTSKRLKWDDTSLTPKGKLVCQHVYKNPIINPFHHCDRARLSAALWCLLRVMLMFLLIQYPIIASLCCVTKGTLFPI